MERISAVFKIRGEQINCPKHGLYDSIKFNGEWTPCPDCVTDAKWDELTKEKAAHHEKCLTQKLKTAGITPRFWGATLDSFEIETEPKQKAFNSVLRYVGTFQDCLRVGRCLGFVGGVGTGKTHLAMAVVRALVEGGHTARHVSSSEYFRAYRGTWRKDSQRAEADVIAEFAAPDFLALDEIGLMEATPHEQRQLFDILDRRYNDLKPTLVITNLPKEGTADKPGLDTYLGPRNYDRLRENGGTIIPFDWASERGRPWKQE